jgi:hypothetical protein
MWYRVGPNTGSDAVIALVLVVSRLTQTQVQAGERALASGSTPIPASRKVWDRLMHHPCMYSWSQTALNGSDYNDITIVLCGLACSQSTAMSQFVVLRPCSAKAALSGADPCVKTRLQCSSFTHDHRIFIVNTS